MTNPVVYNLTTLNIQDATKKGRATLNVIFSFSLSSRSKHHKAGVALGVITIVTGVVFLVDLLLSLRH